MNIFQQAADRPRPELEPTLAQQLLGLAAWLGVAVNALVAFYYWPQLPGEVPQHFNARGEVDAWGSRVLLLILPALSLVMVAGLAWLTRFPHLYNFPWKITEENAARQYELANDLMAAIRAATAWLFALISWEICRIGVGLPPLFGMLFLPIGLVGIFGSVIWYFIRAYQSR